MENLDYKSVLNNDLKIIKKEGKKWDIAIKNILYCILSFVLTIPLLSASSKFIRFELNWAISLSAVVSFDIIWTIKSIINDIKKRNKDIAKTKEDVQSLVDSINALNAGANNKVPKVTLENLKDAIITKDVEEEKGLYDTIKITTTNFFLLNTAGKLRVLREIKNEIADKNFVKEELYLLDDKDIPSDIPVVRSLERK